MNHFKMDDQNVNVNPDDGFHITNPVLHVSLNTGLNKIYSHRAFKKFGYLVESLVINNL